MGMLSRWSSPEKRLAAFREVMTDLHRALKVPFGFELWDTSRVPADLPDDAMRIALSDEGLIAALVQRPTSDAMVDAVVSAYISGRLSLKNGTLFDLSRQRPAGKPARMLKELRKGTAARMLALFFAAPRAARQIAAPGSEAYRRDGRPETNRSNIHHHYDVSNDFYRLFLDERMVYTCAYFQPDWHDDLDRAQHDKLDMVCRKLRLKPGDRLLDIGCGWGALICHAAEHYGVTAVGVTLAEEQAKLARERIAEKGLSDRVTVELKDYALMEGQFDKIASIGMFEHVGIKNHERYFRAVHRLLKPRGLYLHHAIARRAKKTDAKFNKLSPEYKALIRYIFPGGELDHLGMSVANLERYGFEVRDVEGWREHYARTTRLWWERLERNREAAEREVGPERTRLYLLYLAGCSLAFEHASVGINQTLVSRRVKGPVDLPPSRADLYKDFPGAG